MRQYILSETNIDIADPKIISTPWNYGDIRYYYNKSVRIKNLPEATNPGEYLETLMLDYKNPKITIGSITQDFIKSIRHTALNAEKQKELSQALKHFNDFGTPAAYKIPNSDAIYDDNYYVVKRLDDSLDFKILMITKYEEKRISSDGNRPAHAVLHGKPKYTRWYDEKYKAAAKPIIQKELKEYKESWDKIEPGYVDEYDLKYHTVEADEKTLRHIYAEYKQKTQKQEP